MKKIIKWLGIGLGGIVALALVAVAYVWLATDRILDRTYELPESSFDSTAGPADIVAGKRSAQLRGCYAGCHGDTLEGRAFLDEFVVGRFVAPDLTRAFAEMTDREIDLAVRYGIRRDGRSTTMMPSASLHHLTDEELSNITAFIRSFPVGNGPEAEVRPGPLIRILMLKGLFVPEAEQVREDAPWIDEAEAHDGHAQGRYLAITVCGECHAPDLKGVPGFTPPLALTVAYSRDAFGRLMRDGKPLDDRQLGLMEEVAVQRFRHFEESEIDALYAYLVTLATGA